MNVGDWIAIGGLSVTILGGLVTWVRRVETRLGQTLTRQEHEAICERRNIEIKDDIDQLRVDSERRHAENSERLESIATTVTGTHRRIDDLYRDLIPRERR